MSENDIVPELLEKIINDFEENVSLIRAEETFEALLKSNNLEDAYEIAREIGGALSESFSKFITEDILPNGRMYYNIANRIIPPSLQKAYNEAEKFTEVIMSNILSKSKIGIKVQQGLLNQDRIRGIVDRLSEAENYQNVKFLTGKAVVQNVTQSAVDDTIEANAEFHYKSGLRARVERKLGGKCCAWCQKLVGKYTYPDVPEDVYRRHENCRCTVIYYPSKANRGQDVWSKKVIDTKQLNKSTASNNMASNNKTALWKPKNKDNILSPEQYKDLMSYARSKNIELSGFKSFDGDVKTIKTAIDNASAIANKYPKITSGKRKLTLMLDDLMDDADFATTKGHIIHLNANAFRDAKTLEREYQKMVNEKWFVQGTNSDAIISHELGHVVANKYNLDSLQIAKDITGIQQNAQLIDYLEETLSRYSASYSDGREIISECFASVYNSNINNEFALNFVNMCDNIVSN